jgi:hypothetical protein
VPGAVTAPATASGCPGTITFAAKEPAETTGASAVVPALAPTDAQREREDEEREKSQTHGPHYRNIRDGAEI